ncbi:MAG: MlaD family protein [Bacteroidales bacterium]|nr:MlaD family protein [Bacteroidales bacterium]
MQKSKKRYILYGLVGIIILATAYWGLNFLKGTPLFKKTNYYYVYYDRIEGLNKSNAVTVNGYKIGQVADITFLPDDNMQLLITLEITNEFLLPDSTVARIYSMDLMGSKGVELIFGSSKNYHKPNDTLIGQVEQSLKDQVSVQMLPIKNQAEDLMKEIENAIAVITYIFNEETRNNLEKSFASIKTTMEYIEHSAFSLDTLLVQESGKISRILSNVESITLNLRNNHDQISNIINNLSSFSDTLVALNISQTIIQANKALVDFNAIIERVNNGEGSLGQLIKDDKLAKQLENAAENLDKLLKDLRLNPKKYVNFNLMNIGRTVNVSDESELSRRDIRAIENQKRKDEKNVERNLKKEENKSEVEDSKSKNDDSSDVSNADVKFMIQILAASSKIENGSEELHGFSDVVELKIGNRYKYYSYPHNETSQTSYYLEIARQDFPDAFPVAIAGRKPIPYSYGVGLLAEKGK